MTPPPWGWVCVGGVQARGICVDPPPKGSDPGDQHNDGGGVVHLPQLPPFPDPPSRGGHTSPHLPHYCLAPRLGPILTPLLPPLTPGIRSGAGAGTPELAQEDTTEGEPGGGDNRYLYGAFVTLQFGGVRPPAQPRAEPWAGLGRTLS